MTNGMPANRDPFAAFICDDASVDVIRPVITEMGWPTEKCKKGGLRTAVQSLSISASPSILMVDLSESSDPINDINALAEVCEPGTVVIAIGRTNDVELYRNLLSSGIHDYLVKPLNVEQVKTALASAQLVFAAPKTSEADRANEHLATAVVSVRGGSGGSTVATSLAWLLATKHNRNTALLDLDIHFGVAALSMDLEPGRGLVDAIANPNRIDSLFIERAMIRPEEKLAILSAEAPLDKELMTDGASFVQLTEEFRQAFDMTVIDLPREIMIHFPEMMKGVNAIVLVAEMTLASARDTIRILAWLQNNAPETTTILVANRMQSGAQEISKADFESSVEHKVNFALPEDRKASVNAAKLGQTVAQAGSSSKLATALKEVAEAMVEASEDGDIDLSDTGPTSFLDKFDLKSLISKKAKPTTHEKV
ncbi:AAA family ATPase [Altericroceibacterium endophyticum]|uniref:Pilus assembly protein CpaE n=1 Tax=Altericroceibacterium endophyticum TaxID=1808508 RepID=A0A6I4T7R8_9SPHN|nr:pilus assembly protein CpaE [Altericroceibacterium endophyticum]MXO66509.1 pilus assembly protein CpaE [Altericroceibacterium endophyticum]